MTSSLSNPNPLGTFSPRTGRHQITTQKKVILPAAAVSHPQQSLGGSIAMGRVGGGIGISGSTAMSRAMLGSESAKGVGMGSAWRDQGGSLFYKQQGREDRNGLGMGGGGSNEIIKPTPGASYIARRQKTHRVMGGLQNNSHIGTSSNWRFLQEGVTHTDGSPLHALQPLPQPIPLTEEARAYLIEYERAQAMQTPDDGHPTFSRLLHEQERHAITNEQRSALLAEYQAWQHQHGLIPFEEFLQRREEYLNEQQLTYQLQQQQQKQQQEQQQESKYQEHFPQPPRHPPPSHSPHPPAPADENIPKLNARSSLKMDFIPPQVLAHMNAHGAQITDSLLRSASAASNPDEKKAGGSRAEFMHHLERMEPRQSAAASRSSTPGSMVSTASKFSQPHPPSHQKSKPDRSPSSLSTSTDATQPPPTTAEIIQQRHDDASGVEIEDEHDHDHDHDEHDQQLQHVEDDQLAPNESESADQVTCAPASTDKPTQPPPSTSRVHSRHSHAAADRRSPPGTTASQRARDDEIRERLGLDREQTTRSGRSKSRGQTTAKVASGANEQKDDDESDSSSTSRDSSPVILWKATNRVKEAIDIPNELRSVFLAEPDDDQDQLVEDEKQEDGSSSYRKSPLSQRKSTRLYAPQSLTTLQRIALTRTRGDFNPASTAMQELELNLNPRFQAGRQRAKVARVKEARRQMRHGGTAAVVAAVLASQPPPPPESSFTYKPYEPRLPKKFGAWYLPTSLWIAETKPQFKTRISQRVNTSKAHMALGSWGGIGFSLHGKDTLQAGQAEYEEARKHMGLNGLATWAEIQAGALIGSTAALMPGQAIQTREEEDEDIDVAGKINLIKAQALEARSHRRRILARVKVEQYEKNRLHKKARIVQTQLKSKGIFQKNLPPEDVDGHDGMDETDLDRLGSNPLTKHPLDPDGAQPQSIEEKLALLKAEIPHLQISQEYKAYVQKVGARMPHYLSRVVVNAEFLANQRESARASEEYNASLAKVQSVAGASTSSAVASPAASPTSLPSSQPSPTTEDEFSLNSNHTARAKPFTRNVAANGLANRVNLHY